MPDTTILPAVEKNSARENQNIKFARCEGFMQTLRGRVDDYFETNQLSKRDNIGMYVKSAIILSWLVASYVVLVFFPVSVAITIIASVSLGFAMAAVGFNIQHDGGHGAYSKYPIVNNLMAFTMDIIGVSSFIWKRTHNIIHHSYTNITGVDGDIDLGVLGRLSPHQSRLGFHRFQHVYLWLLYGAVTIKWQLVDDTVALITGKSGDTKVPSPKPLELIVLLAGKLIFVTLAFGIPLYLYAWYNVLIMFFLVSFVHGFLLSVVFQLAHCVEEAEFPLPEGDTSRMENAWAIHQVETTVDFARGNPIVCWFTGGLNYQIEHHLFPKICHVYYPALSKIVEETSAEFGVLYHAHPTVRSAVASHYNWLRKMGQPEAQAC